MRHIPVRSGEYTSSPSTTHPVSTLRLVNRPNDCDNLGILAHYDIQNLRF
jgi:hypothetical protein